MSIMNNPLNILIVEDNPGDVALLEALLEQTDMQVSAITQATYLSEAIDLLNGNSFNLILLDLSLPDSSGIDSFTKLDAVARKIPLILLTGNTNTEIGLEALSLGAQDYLVKGEFDEKLLARAIRYSMERKRNLERIRENEQQYRLLFEENPIPMWVIDKHTLNFLEINEAAINNYGYAAEEYSGKRISELHLSDDKGWWKELINPENEQGNEVFKKRMIQRHIKKNGDGIIAEIATHRIDYRGTDAVLVLANDITEKTRLERELARRRFLEKRQITEAVIMAQERERTEIGKELHDNINQILGAAHLYVNTAMNDEELRESLLLQSSNFINKAINEIREISKTLIVPGIRDVGLVESISDLLEKMRIARKIRIEFHTNGFPEDKLDESRLLTLYRIVQEQVNNIIKHADAGKVVIHLHADEIYIHLTISDNGKGFDITTQRKGIGITNIISRVELFNGKVEIQSAPGKGCNLDVQIPLV